MGVPILFRPLKEISELNQHGALMDKAKLKKDIEILLIDDKDVPFLEFLTRNDYHIKHHNDLTDFNLVKSFDIILCDVQGVGTSLSPTLQGAHIVKEIKKLYPFKQVIAFTANPSDPDIVPHLHTADKFLSKDANEDEWIDALDNCIQKYSNPVKQWKEIRKMLLDCDVSTKSVAHLESNFVKAIQSKNQDLFLNTQNDYPDISKHVWEILGGLATLIKLFAPS